MNGLASGKDSQNRCFQIARTTASTSSIVIVKCLRCSGSRCICLKAPFISTVARNNSLVVCINMPAMLGDYEINLRLYSICSMNLKLAPVHNSGGLGCLVVVVFPPSVMILHHDHAGAADFRQFNISAHCVLDASWHLNGIHR